MADEIIPVAVNQGGEWQKGGTPVFRELRVEISFLQKGETRIIAEVTADKVVANLDPGVDIVESNPGQLYLQKRLV
ncbi:hypothetical protein A2160_00825 [Candidatus Beckwithbacteria bacterium RBG_13_42_9]|uniref:Uncharacterized protein n=1 Tax=Candidatus Beckwithbacteria bacterium RBG_13_42_9 TaxID=1797457 RepID=A0A1F5E3K8_9BACT|nr:MAG: hypothetical protein A2160_00825 [Candidatus Beckwithbacteria bacterium RBG_13_42_9]